MPMIRDINVEWVSLVDRAAVRQAENPDQPQRFLIYKRQDPPEGDTMTPEETTAALAKAESERDEAKAALAKTETEREEAKGALAKAQESIKKMGEANANGPGGPGTRNDGDPDPDPKAADGEPVSKADLPKAWRERIEKMEADQQASEKRALQAETIAKAEREERLTREFITKAQTYRSLPVDAQEFGPVLKRAAERMSESDYQALETVLKAADSQISKGALFAELGRGGAPAGGGEDHDELVAKTQAIRKADPSLTEWQATQQAMASDREAQARYLASVR